MPIGAGNRPTQTANRPAEHTKQLCSGVFVVGRNPYEFTQNDLRTIDHYYDWDSTSVDIDFGSRTVTLTDDQETREQPSITHPSGVHFFQPTDPGPRSIRPSSSRC